MRGQSSAGRRGSWQDTAERDCGNLYRISGVSDVLQLSYRHTGTARAILNIHNIFVMTLTFGLSSTLAKGCVFTLGVSCEYATEYATF